MQAAVTPHKTKFGGLKWTRTTVGITYVKSLRFDEKRGLNFTLAQFASQIGGLKWTRTTDLTLIRRAL